MSNKIYHWTSTFKALGETDDGGIDIKGSASTNGLDRAGDIIESGAWTKGGLENFKNNPRKGQYAYLLTPKGVREKSLLTHRFIERKRQEYDDLRAEIELLEREAGLAYDPVIKARDDT